MQSLHQNIIFYDLVFFLKASLIDLLWDHLNFMTDCWPIGIDIKNFPGAGFNV